MADGESTILQGLLNAHDPYSAATQILNEHPKAQLMLKELKNIKKILEDKSLIIKNKVGSSNKLKGLLPEGNGYVLVKDRDKIKAEEDIIKKCVFDAYHLTSEILQELEFISNVEYTFTYIDSHGNFKRSHNMDLTLEDINLEAASSSRGYYSLRLKESAIKMKIDESTNIDAMELLNQHFQAFAQMFFDYENNNNTGWKINKGVLAEAFERHWENQGDSIDNTITLQRNNIGNDLESIGKRWWLYRLSSGSDPYYTGPDTVYSQVKNANASLIDNVETVLNTMEALINFFDNTVSIKNLAINLNKAFTANISKFAIPKSIWDDLSMDAQQELINAVAESLGISNTQIGTKTTFRTKVNKITKEKTKVGTVYILPTS